MAGIWFCAKIKLKSEILGTMLPVLELKKEISDKVVRTGKVGKPS